jgi:molybdopterin converting factor small subunit
MITITAKFLGGIRRDIGIDRAAAVFEEGSGIEDLVAWLRSLGVDPDAEDIIITVAGLGLRQLPDDYRLKGDQAVAVFPMISGG